MLLYGQNSLVGTAVVLYGQNSGLVDVYGSVGLRELFSRIRNEQL